MQKVNLKEKANDAHWLEWLGIRTSLQVQNYLSEMARLWGLHAGLGKSLSPRRSAWLCSSIPANEPPGVIPSFAGTCSYTLRSLHGVFGYHTRIKELQQWLPSIKYPLLGHFRRLYASPENLRETHSQKTASDLGACFFK